MHTINENEQHLNNMISAYAFLQNVHPRDVASAFMNNLCYSHDHEKFIKNFLIDAAKLFNFTPVIDQSMRP